MADFRPAGYLTLTPKGYHGRPGSGYDYVTAANGLFVQCRNHMMAARVRLARAQVRGLAEAEERLQLMGGPIPSEIFEAGLSWMMTTPREEKMFAIRLGPGGYQLEIPRQEGAAASVLYEPQTDAVAEFHSHGAMNAFFSKTDDADEQGFRIYGVCGRLDRAPELILRVGVYGHFGPAQWEDVFDGQGPLIRDARDRARQERER